MTSAPARDQVPDHLHTSQNAAFLLIDYQPQQLTVICSTDQALLVRNTVSAVRLIRTSGVPVVHSTVDVASSPEQPAFPSRSNPAGTP